MATDQFRDDIRRWLKENAPLSLCGRKDSDFEGYWGGKKFTSPHPDYDAWLEIAYQKGLTAPSWPVEYGGGGYSKLEEKIIMEEIVALRLPLPLIGIGLHMIGPTILDYGTDEQKRFFLPKIASGQIRWCQGFSEPGAGSDLASLSTAAKIDGSGKNYIVNGQKIWTSYGHLSDWIFTLVRTEKAKTKQEGISFLLVDLNSPGITVKPIKLISGASSFCETFYDDVSVPRENLLGELNKGWQVAKTLLGYERITVSNAMGKFPIMGRPPRKVLRPSKEGTTPMGAFALGYHHAHNGTISDTKLRAEIADFEMQQMAYKLFTDRVAEHSRAKKAFPASLALKLIGMEMNQKRQALSMKIAGLNALGWEGSSFSQLELDCGKQWLRSRANSIEGGTSEIQLNIIAKRILGLPQ